MPETTLRVAARAGDLELAKVNGAVALQDDVQVGFLGIGIDGGLVVVVSFAKGYFLRVTALRTEVLLLHPAVLVEVFTNGLLPVFHRILVSTRQVVVIQYVAEDGHADVVDFGARAGGDVDGCSSRRGLEY